MKSFITQTLIDKMVELVKGRVSLIISGHAYVSREAKIGPRQRGIHSDDFLSGLAQIMSSIPGNDPASTPSEHHGP